MPALERPFIFNVLIVLVDQGTKHVLLFQTNTEKESLRKRLWSIKQECLPNGIAGLFQSQNMLAL